MIKKNALWMIPFSGLGIVAMAVGLFLAEPAHALPEYASRTGEACATCHVNPGGGGPRTLLGALWSARGKPDKVPLLPNVLLAPGVTEGSDLFEIACAACHGYHGEGLFGSELENTSLKAAKIRSTILKGRLLSGMPAFDGKFTDAQLQVLVAYVAALADGTAILPPLEYPLGSPVFNCSPQSNPDTYGGN